MTDYEQIDDHLDDFNVGLILAMLLRTGDAIAAARETPEERQNHGTTFVTGLWIGVVAAKNPKYVYGLRNALARAMSRTGDKTAEQVEAEALQLLREGLKGTIFDE